MEWIVELLSTIGIFVGALLILVFIHELGHFLAAKLFGMRVERFSLGFPPRIWGFTKGETDYCISATPLGGYVKISGMIDESMDTEYLNKEPEPWEFRSKPVWQRMVVISAGVIFNVILASLIFAGIVFTTGEQRIPNESVTGIYVSDSSLVHDVGFRTGDKIIGVNGHHPKYYRDFYSPAELTASRLNYSVRRNGQVVHLSMPDSLLDEINKRDFLSLSNLLLPSTLGRIQPGSPAENAGIKAGDTIVAVDGEPIQYWQQLVTKIQAARGSLHLQIKRDGEIINKEVTPNENHILGVGVIQNDKVFRVEHIKYGFLGALGYGVHKSGETLQGIVQGFEKLFSGDISVRENLGGPVQIATITKQQTDRGGWVGFWSVTALLSLTLAIMNILPIPVLDGGHLMFLLYEGITRREPSEKVRMALQQIGLVLILGLIILVTFNDILRLF